MKKVILFAAVAASIALASCGGHKTEEATTVDSMAVDTAVVVDTMAAVVDSAAVVADSAVVIAE